MDRLIDIYQGQSFWVWVALGAALLAVEVMTGSGWLLWAAGSAAITGLAALAGLSGVGAIVLFAALTIVSTLLAQRYFPRQLEGSRHNINDNVARLIGHRGQAVSAFAARQGRVFIDGKEWAAELDAQAAELSAGQAVEVVSVHGAQLRVRPI